MKFASTAFIGDAALEFHVSNTSRSILAPNTRSKAVPAIAELASPLLLHALHLYHRPSMGARFAKVPVSRARSEASL